MTAPFENYAQAYREGGWQPFPLPLGRKSPPPKGVTGAVPYDVDDELWAEWIRYRGLDNIGLRIPDGVLAIDVDEHDDKRGGNTIKALARRLGPLTPTFRVSARNAGSAHGHYLYRVPRGLAWQSSAGPDVEVIHPRHRYLVGAGSVVEGRVYIVYEPDLSPCSLPSTSQLPELGRPWARELCRGRARDARMPQRDLSLQVDAWQRELAAGSPSAQVRQVVRGYRRAPQARGSAYDTMVAAVATLVALGNEGQPGVQRALRAIERTYAELRGQCRDASGEFYRALEGAVQKRFGTPPAVGVIAKSPQAVRRG